MLLKSIRNYEDDYYYYVIFQAVSGDREGQYNLHIYSKRFGNQEYLEWYSTFEDAEAVIFAKSKDAYS